MIKDLIEQQNKSKNAYFARQLTALLNAKGIEPSPKLVAAEFNLHLKSNVAKAHTVRKWLLGVSKPSSAMLVHLADWLNVDPRQLLRPAQGTDSLSKVSLEFDFTDQEAISKYLAMTSKEKLIVRLLIDTIAEKQRLAAQIKL
jgi:transcriptional regulator with XRE-family HTH domain